MKIKVANNVYVSHFDFCCESMSMEFSYWKSMEIKITVLDGVAYGVVEFGPCREFKYCPYCGAEIQYEFIKQEEE